MSTALVLLQKVLRSPKTAKRKRIVTSCRKPEKHPRRRCQPERAMPGAGGGTRRCCGRQRHQRAPEARAGRARGLKWRRRRWAPRPASGRSGAPSPLGAGRRGWSAAQGATEPFHVTRTAWQKSYEAVLKVREMNGFV